MLLNVYIINDQGHFMIIFYKHSYTYYVIHYYITYRIYELEL